MGEGIRARGRATKKPELIVRKGLWESPRHSETKKWWKCQERLKQDCPGECSVAVHTLYACTVQHRVIGHASFLST